MSSPSVPGLVWSKQIGSSVLRVLRVAPRGQRLKPHYTLSRNLRPIGPPTFTTLYGAVSYAAHEWLGHPRTLVDAGLADSVQ